MLGDHYCVASETCAFDIIGAQLPARRPARRGRVADAAGGSRRAWRSRARASALCVFEHIYFARPGLAARAARCCRCRAGRMGEILAREAPADADLVIAVPDSGNAAARGYARASGLPQDDGFVKNRYVARTFIQPGQELRKHGLRMKFNPLPEIVGRPAAGRGRRLDRPRQHDAPDRPDAARRGRERGPHAHLRAADPQPLPLRDRHVHARGDDRPRPHGGGGRRGAGRRLARVPVARRACTRRSAARASTHCDACFSGDYPLANTGETQTKDAFERSSARAPSLARGAVRRLRPATGVRADAATVRSSDVRRLLVRERDRGPALAIASQMPRLAMNSRRASISPASSERAASSRGARQLGLEAVARAPAEAVRAPGQAVPRGGGLDPVGEPGAERGGALEGRGRLDVRERRDDGGERERVGVRRPAGGDPGDAAVRVAVALEVVAQVAVIPYAPTGTPPPRLLPSVTMSGSSPRRACSRRTPRSACASRRARAARRAPA